jgi:uncharacterized membrane protein
LPNARHSGALRLLLALAYPLLAHLASDRHSGAFAALALVDILLILLLRPLLLRRAWAWMVLALGAAATLALMRLGLALLPLLLVPVGIIGLVAYGFGRTLRSVPLITRLVAGLDGVPPAQLAPELLRYTRNLTGSWTVLLATLALLNLLLALLAVPNGLLASLGVTPPLTVSQAQWSWFANVLNFGIMIGFFLVEFAVRQRRFPGRYRNLLDFLQRVARLGPAFWRDVAR